MLNPNEIYLDQLLSLSRTGYFEPWKVQFQLPNALAVTTYYLADAYHEEGDTYADRPVIRAGSTFQYLLDCLLPGIPRYPYVWGLEGQKIYAVGYDFSLSSDLVLELTDGARQLVWAILNVPDPQEALTFALEQPVTVSGRMLTKLMLTAEKAGLVSTLAFQLYATKPMTLLSLVYESDLSGAGTPRVVNLNEVSVQQTNGTVKIRLGEPIRVKRLTVVFAQNNAESNDYILDKTSEDFTYTSVQADEDWLAEYTENALATAQQTVYVTNEILSDAAIADWSEERKAAYLKWRAQKTAYLNSRNFT